MKVKRGACEGSPFSHQLFRGTKGAPVSRCLVPDMFFRVSIKRKKTTFFVFDLYIFNYMITFAGKQSIG